MLKPLFLLSLMLSPFVMASSNAATYYKWTDKNGVPHYSQYAPTNGVNLRQVQVVNTRELGPSSRARLLGPSSRVLTTCTCRKLTPLVGAYWL